MNINCQIYVQDSVDAVAFYQKAFDLTLGMHFIAEDGTYAHASLMHNECEILAIAENKDEKRRAAEKNKSSIMVFTCSELGTKEAVINAYSVLSAGALHNQNPDGPASVPWSELCFSLVDKFGVGWWVSI